MSDVDFFGGKELSPEHQVSHTGQILHYVWPGIGQFYALDFSASA